MFAKAVVGFVDRMKYLFGKIPMLAFKMEGGPVDPITAVFNFLATPVGQQLLQPLVAAEADLAHVIADLIRAVHAKVNSAPVPPAPPAKS